MWRHWMAWGLVFSLLLAACGDAARRPVVQASSGPDRRVVNFLGEEAAAGGELSAFVVRRVDEWLAEPVTIVAGSESRTTTRADLGARLRTDEALESLVAAMRAERGGHAVDTVTVPLTVDAASLRSFLEPLARDVARAPEAGRMDFDARTVVPSRAGVVLDVTASIASIERLLRTGASLAKLPTREDWSSSDDDAAVAVIPKDLSLAVSLAQFETRFKRTREKRERAHNVQLAAATLHGAVIPAFDILSFNKQVGARTASRGFRSAPVIFKGELIEGMGGGVCQVASTLHAAALHAGLEVVSHEPHSRASSYIAPGFDATVVWPDVDLVLRNPYPFPVAVRATADNGVLRVELFGPETPRTVEVLREVLEERLFTRRFVNDPSLAAGARVVQQEGVPGYRVRVARRFGADAAEEARVLLYQPADRIIRVGVGG